MARLMDGEIEKLKQEVSLLDLVQSYGVKLKKKGKDLIGLCPFHDDHSPSLDISPDKNLWHCLGVCQEGGPVIDWVMKSEGISLKHALEILKERESPDVLGGEIKHVKRATIRKLDSPFDFDSDKPVENQVLLNQVIDFYHQTMKQNPEGIEYLQKCGLKNLDMIERFKLGLCDRTLCYRLPARDRQAGEEIRGKLIELGILRQSGHEHFRGSLVIPVFGENSNIVEIYGRKIGKSSAKILSFISTCQGRIKACGNRLVPGNLSRVVGDYVRDSGIGKEGSCHIFRYTMATLMLDGSAYIRYIQEMLGHSRLETTHVYTSVSKKKLKEVHNKSNPGQTLNEKGNVNEATQ